MRAVTLTCVKCTKVTLVDEDLVVHSLPVTVWWEKQRGRLCKDCYHQPTLLDLTASREARDEGIARVDAHAVDEWKEQAKDAVVKLAHQQAEVTSDDIWAMGVPKPSEPRALGPVMLWARKEKLLRSTGRTRQTAQVSGHAHPVTVWESLVHRPDYR